MAQKKKKKTNADHGRGTDSVLGHLSLGEVVIPRAFMDNPEVMQLLKHIFELGGADINEFTVGDKANKINPETGYPEFFNWGKALAILGPLALSIALPGIGTAIGGSMLGAGAAGSATLGNALLGGGLGLLTGGTKGALNGALSGGIGANLGGLFGMGDAASAGAKIGTGAGYSAPIGPLNPATSMGNVAMGSQALSSAAPVGAAEQSLLGKAGDYLKTPQGLSLGLGALGMLSDSGNQDPYADEAAKKRAADNNYVRYSGGMADTRFAKGGSVHTESDMTSSPRPDPRAMQQMAATVHQLEQKMGRSLNEEEMQELMDRMGGGVGQMMPSPYAAGGPVSGIGSGKSDDIPAMLSDGEHVITADEVSMLGDGSNGAGHKKLYAMRKKLRKHKTGRTKQMPMAKSPESYAGIGA